MSKTKTTAELINQTSGECEWYTPPEIVEAARRVLGTIDLDPASSEIANQRVRATKYYTKADQDLNDGRLPRWDGRVWMNHPFGRTTNGLFVKHLEDCFLRGYVTEACCITYACTSEAWFQPLMRRPQCYLSPRTNYYLPNGKKKKGVTKGSVVTYYGRDVAKFAREFNQFGVIKVPYGV